MEKIEIEEEEKVVIYLKATEVYLQEMGLEVLKAAYHLNVLVRPHKYGMYIRICDEYIFKANVIGDIVWDLCNLNYDVLDRGSLDEMVKAWRKLK